MTPRIRRRLVRFGAAGVAALALTVGAGRHVEWPHSSAVPQTQTTAAAAATADIAQLLTEIPSATTIDAVSGYDRSCKTGHSCVFGPAWNSPLDKSGCDTRSRILAAQLHDVQFKPGTHDCKVIAGWVDDPYTGQRITLHDIQIDHVVPLKFSWDAGAWQWTQQQRAIFANDTDNLLAVSAHENSSKGDSSLSEYLPKVGQCAYVAKFLTVAAKYKLPIADADRAAAIAACPANSS